MPNIDIEPAKNLENLFSVPVYTRHKYTFPNIRTHVHESCIAPRAAGRRHGRYKWAGQPVVPSGHRGENARPCRDPPDARRTRKSERTKVRGEGIGGSEGLGEPGREERLSMVEASNGGISDPLAGAKRKKRAPR